MTVPYLIPKGSPGTKGLSRNGDKNIILLVYPGIGPFVPSSLNHPSNPRQSFGDYKNSLGLFYYPYVAFQIHLCTECAR